MQNTLTRSRLPNRFIRTMRRWMYRPDDRRTALHPGGYTAIRSATLRTTLR